MSQLVAFGITVPAYNPVPPFHPDARFPESRFPEVSKAPNWPYRLLRRLFFDLELDSERFGAQDWNPLGVYIKPGQTVLLKPNYVLSFNAGGGDIFHGCLTLDQLFSARPMLGHGDYRGPLRGLYMCGAGTHPGGGVSGAPGHNAAREILRDLKRRKFG